MKLIDFAEAWGAVPPGQIRPISPTKARARFKSGAPVSMQFRDEDDNIRVVTTSKAAAICYFYDHLSRLELEYAFNRSRDGTSLFLEEARYTDHAGNPPLLFIFRFNQEGDFECQTYTSDFRSVEARSGTYNPAGNMEPFPSFDSCSDLLKYERPLPSP